MKKLTTLFMLLLMLMTTTLFGCGNSPDEVTVVESGGQDSTNCINEILLNSDYAYESFFGEENPFVTGEKYFEVSRQDDTFFIDNNGEKTEFEVTPKSQKEEELEFLGIKDIDLETTYVVEMAKEKVCKFVEQAGFFEEGVIDKLNKVEVKFTDSEYTAFYYDRHKTIYIGAKESVCEWMLVHEYVHALAAITNGNENQSYYFYMFNEIFTDIITASMHPEIPVGVSSQYMQFDLVVYNFIHVFKEDAIKAYFYGYNEIIEATSEEEIDMFVEVVENLEGGTITEDYYRALILKLAATQ